MKRKIAFIGAGSMVFTRNLVRDLLTFPAFGDDLEIALCDISEKNLGYSKSAVERILKDGGYGAKMTTTTDRRVALEGADGVLTTIAVGKPGDTLVDCGIPEKYGVTVCVGDTRGPQGIFRYLRTIPAIMEIVRDMEKLCPDAVLLNYTNPMAMICRTIQEASSITTTGLCHSVQGTAMMLARWIGAPFEDITYLCAGINHQAHYLNYKWNGKDAYPLIREKILNDKEIYESEKVRNEMYLALNYYVTESSVHNSEYNAWFRKRPELIEQYLREGSTLTSEKIKSRLDPTGERRAERMNTWLAEPFTLERGHEYAAYIFNAIFGDYTIFEFNGNIRNFGLIDNLPHGCCVESPVEASRAGLRPIHVGPLPANLAILNGIHAQIEDMAVHAYLTGDRDLVYQCNYFDPNTSSVLSLKEIRAMTDEMFEAGKEWLPI
ncbi:MAG: alpha-glucosidase/alpha-galactosidase [Oscillospiraceae bacterium]|nr:alpha-glucosidase/alpha-galactosidase [Oscillospiraceae bacterium]